VLKQCAAMLALRAAADFVTSADEVARRQPLKAKDIAANFIRHDANLTRLHADKFGNCFYFHRYALPTLAALSARFPPCPRNVLVGANSPSLCPIMFSVTNTGMCLRPS